MLDCLADGGPIAISERSASGRPGPIAISERSASGRRGQLSDGKLAHHPLGPGGEIHPLDAVPLPAKYTISAGDPNRGATQVASFDAHNVGYLAARNLPTSR